MLDHHVLGIRNGSELFAPVVPLLFRKRDNGPCGWKEPDTLFWTKAFQQNAALHLNLHSAAAGLNGDFAYVQNVAALAVVDLVVAHQAFADDDDISLRRYVAPVVLLGRPAEWFGVRVGKFLE